MVIQNLGSRGPTSPRILGKLDATAVSALPAKLLVVAYLVFMLALISVLTLPKSLLFTFSLLMFCVNTGFILLMLSSLKTFHNNLGGLIGSSVAISISTQSFFFVMLTDSGFRWLTFLIIPVIYATFITARRTNHAHHVFTIKYIDVLVLATVSLITLLFSLFFRAAHSIATIREFLELPADIPIFGTMIRALSTTGLEETGLIAGFPIKYHWLSYGYLSSLDLGTSMDLIPLIAYFTPALLLFTTLWLIAGISSVSWMPTISPILGIVGALCLSYVGVSRNSEFSNFPYFSPSTLLGGTLVLSLSFIVLRSSKLGFNLQGTALIALLTGFVFLAKVSAGIVFLAALGLLTLYSFVFLRTIFRTLVYYFLFASVLGFTFYLIFLAGSGNEIAIDETVVFDFSVPIQSFLELGVPFAALVAIIVPWAGILIRNPEHAKLPIEQIWALSLGIPALLLYTLTTAPDQNDKFFVIAAGIFIFPISFLAVLSFLGKLRRLGASPTRMTIYLAFVAILSGSLFFFSGTEFFDIRPLLFPVLTLLIAIGLGTVFTLLVSGRMTRNRNILVNASLSTLVIVSLFFSLFNLILPRIDYSNQSSAPYIPSEAQDRIESYLPDTIQMAKDFNPLSDQFITFVVQGPDSNTIERWVRFASGQPSFTAGESDVQRLSSDLAGEALLSRNKKVLDFLASGSVEVGHELCAEGLRAIWVYPYNYGKGDTSALLESSNADLVVVDLGCDLE